MPNWKKVVTSGSSAQLSDLTIQSPAGSGDLLTLHNTTNGSGASIKFTDQSNGSQTGTLDFLHSNNANSQDGGAIFQFQSTEDDLVLSVGTADSTHGRMTVWGGANNSKPDYAFGQDLDTGMLRTGANALRLVTGGTAALSIDSSQNITVAGTVDGRDLATDGTKLDGIDDNANNYVLPTNLAGDDINIDTGALTGATVISDLDFNITTNTSGLVTDANGTVSTRTLTAADLSLGSSDNVTFGSITISTGKIDYGTNTAVDTGTENVATATGAEAAFFDYVVKNSTNVRAGTVTAATDGTNVEFNEVSTVDLGDTSDIKLKVVLSSGDLILQATAASDNWNVSSFVRYMAL